MPARDIITDDDLILVTGASGYLASHVIKQLLEAGYRVRGTVRSVKDKKKTDSLKKLAVNTRHELELVEADLTDENSWPKAVEGCTYVIHTASPLPSIAPKDEMEVIKPAVEGVLNVFKACVQPGQRVKRVIQTSSLVVIAGNDIEDGKVYNESDNSDLKTSQPYTKSKILSEKVAWDFVIERRNKGQPCFDLVVLNPGFIIGPIIHDGICASMDVPKAILCREMPVLPNITLPSVDVRDVALAHIKSLSNNEVVGRRNILISNTEPFTFQTYAKWLSEEFGPKGYKISTMVAPNRLLKMVSCFDKRLEAVIPLLGKSPKFDNSRYINVLGIQPHDPKKSLIDMAYSMIEKGHIPKKY